IYAQNVFDGIATTRRRSRDVIGIECADDFRRQVPCVPAPKQNDAIWTRVGIARHDCAAQRKRFTNRERVSVDQARTNEEVGPAHETEISLSWDLAKTSHSVQEPALR